MAKNTDKGVGPAVKIIIVGTDGKFRWKTLDERGSSVEVSDETFKTHADASAAAPKIGAASKKDETPALDKMTKAELVAFAAEKGIDISAVPDTKAEILAVVEAGLKKPE